jgi:hypothetical protein
MTIKSGACGKMSAPRRRWIVSAAQGTGHRWTNVRFRERWPYTVGHDDHNAVVYFGFNPGLGFMSCLGLNF